MKKLFSVLFLFTAAVFYSQTTQNDNIFFIQFNNDKLTQKVSVDEFLNHPLISEFNSKSAKLNLKDITEFIRFDKKITVEENTFSEDFLLYQITIPIKNKTALRDFLLKKTDNKSNLPVIEDFPNYSISNQYIKKSSLIFNDDYLVIAKLTLKDPYSYYLKEDNNFDDDDKLSSMQENYLKSIFENGFVAPSSTKVNENADISSWINHSLFISNSIYLNQCELFFDFKSVLFQKSIANVIKGYNVDVFFDNDNARIEETVEYSEPISKIMAKIIDRKINKNIYNYFPKKEPLAYFSYHLNSEEILKNIPNITEEFLKFSKIKEEVLVFSDLITTLIDEKAIATLFDGDLSIFLHDYESREITSKSHIYDENYERIETEVTKNESIPMLTMVFTSTHPTLYDKLIQYGLKKEQLVQKNGRYYIPNTEKYGNLFIIKDKDVIVLGNSLDYFDLNKKGSFVKTIKKETKKNYFITKINLSKTFEVYLRKSEETDSEKIKKADAITHVFNNITLSFPKKIDNNRLKGEIKFNSTKTDKNIILQTLDLIQLINQS